MEGWFGQHEDILLGEPMDNQKNQKINKSGGFIRIDVNNSSLPLFPSLTTKRKPVIILVLDKDIQGTCHKPVVKEISEILKTCNLFIYVGHEAGSQHIPIDALEKLDRCAPIDYVLAGSPIVVGNLWVVRQTWALEFTKKLLKTFEGELEDEAGIVACLDLARKTYNNLMYRAGRPGELWKAPWGTDTIVDTILPNFKWIVKDFEDGSFTGTLDGRISNIICHMEGWFGQHEDILLEEPMDGLYVRLGC
ncbi:separase isoform X2 [Tanacetum coccineum]